MAVVTDKGPPARSYTMREWAMLRVRRPGAALLAKLDLVREVFDGELVRVEVNEPTPETSECQETGGAQQLSLFR